MAPIPTVDDLFLPMPTASQWIAAGIGADDHPTWECPLCGVVVASPGPTPPTECPGEIHRMPVQDAQNAVEGMLRRLRGLQAAIDRVKADAKNQVAEIREWEAGQIADYQSEMVELEVRVKPLARVVVAADPRKRKSVMLAQGTVGFREENSTATTVTSADECCDWLEANGYQDLVKTERHPRLVELKRIAEVRGDRYTMQIDGIREIIPGLTATVTEGETFYVTPR